QQKSIDFETTPTLGWLGCLASRHEGTLGELDKDIIYYHDMASGPRLRNVIQLSLGDVYRDSGRWKDAQRAYDQIVLECTDSGDQVMTAAARGQRATLHFLRRDYRAAYEEYHETLEAFTRMGHQREMGKAWHQIGMVHKAVQQPDEAERALLHALAIFSRLDYRYGEARTRAEFGHLYLQLEKFELAEQWYKSADNLFRPLEQWFPLSQLHVNLATALLAQQKFGEAQEAISSALELGMSEKGEGWKAFSVQADIHRLTGHLEAAEEARRRAVEALTDYIRQGGAYISRSTRLIEDLRKEQETSSGWSRALQQARQDPKASESFQTLVQRIDTFNVGEPTPPLDGLDLEEAVALTIYLDQYQNSGTDEAE
ncbi:MAG: tetratricopeptide repeat protein, partial [Verrucomicrobiota bacterium]